ncbi:transmembrane protein 18, partial [Kipferlia bialata]
IAFIVFHVVSLLLCVLLRNRTQALSAFLFVLLVLCSLNDQVNWVCMRVMPLPGRNYFDLSKVFIISFWVLPILVIVLWIYV